MNEYKYSVVTTNFGNYENIQEVKNPRKDVEYILVTDNPNLKYNTWKTVIFTNYDKLLSPDLAWIYVKFFTFNYCTTDICLYIDGSIKILDDFNELIEYFLNNKYEYAATIESNYGAADYMLTTWGKYKYHDYNEEIANKVLNNLTQSGFDVHKFGLLATSFLLKRKTSFTQKIDEDTWNILSNNGEAEAKEYRVMEPAFTFSLEKNAYHDSRILILDHNIKWSPWFSWCFHNTTRSTSTVYNRSAPLYFQYQFKWVFQNEVVSPVSYIDIKYCDKKQPLLTVVITAYNKEKTIKRAINSVKQMSYTNWECIIVDNDSEDNTESIVMDNIEDDTRFIYVRQRNKNLCNSRNVGSFLGNGKYLIHVDGDDTIGKTFCEHAIYELEKNEKYCIASGVFRRVFMEGHCNYHITSAQEINTFPPNYKIKTLISVNPFPVESVFRMSIYKKIQGYREGIEKFTEDNEMIIRYFDAAAPNNDVYYIPSETVASLYEQKNSKSKQFDVDTKTNNAEFYKYNKELYEKYLTKEEIAEFYK